MIVLFLMLMHRRWQSEFSIHFCHQLSTFQWWDLTHLPYLDVSVLSIFRRYSVAVHNNSFPFVWMWDLSFNGPLVHISEFELYRIPVLLLDKIYFECDKHSPINWFVIWYIFIYIYEAIKCHRPRTCTLYGNVKTATKKKNISTGKKRYEQIEE